MGLTHVTVAFERFWRLERRLTRRTFSSILVPQIVLHQPLNSKRSASGGWKDSLRTCERASRRVFVWAGRDRVYGRDNGGTGDFGPDGVEPILGVTALESVGITIDPASSALKR